MPTKKVIHNMDERLISSQIWECDYICKVFRKDNGEVRLTLVQLKDIMMNLGSKGKPCRSRRNVYIGIRAAGFKYYPISLKAHGINWIKHK